MKPFIESQVCLSGSACTHCREEYSFRESLTVLYTFPDNNINFTCPFGKGPVTGFQFENTNEQDMKLYQSRLEICKTCENYTTINNEPACLLVKGPEGCKCNRNQADVVSVSALRKLTVLQEPKCPLNKWDK